MINFPDLNIAEHLKNDDWCRRWLDAIDQYYRGPDNSFRKERINSNYDSHNGILNSKTIQLNQAKYGKSLSTPLKDYYIGRTKIASLVGEWLEMPLIANVFTTNREAIIKKLDNFMLLYGAIAAKKEIQDVQKDTGFSVMNDMKIPDAPEGATTDDIKSLAAFLNPKSNNEVIMQAILNDKIRRGKMKMSLIESLKDLILTSEIHGKIDRDQEGKDYFRPIPAPYAIFEEALYDYGCDRSPFRGEYRPLFEHELLGMFDFSPSEKLQLKSAFEQGNFENINNFPMIPTIWGEIKTTRPVIQKISKSKTGKEYKKFLDPKEYEKNFEGIQKDIAAGKYTLVVKYKEDIWAGVKIGQNMYKNMERKTNQIQVKGSGKYHRAKSDYISFLVGTVKGKRIAVQDVIKNLSEVYNYVMWQIVREIKKNKGRVFVYDEAALPTTAKNIKNVLYDLEENNVIRINSAEDGNLSQKSIDQATQLITALDLGLSASFTTLVETKREIERTIDRLTGVSEQREGFGKATETATATQSRLSGSQAVTGEIFYSFQEFVNTALMALAEKTKNNDEYLENEGKYILGDDQKIFLTNTKELSFDEYGAYMSNGRKEMEVRMKLEQYFPAEVNAGMLRSRDIAAFSLADSITEGLAILDKAYDVISKTNNAANASKEKIAAEQNANAVKMAEAAREDTQAHEKELLQMKLDAEAKKGVTKVAGDQIKNLDSIQSSERIADATMQQQPPV